MDIEPNGTRIHEAEQGSGDLALKGELRSRLAQLLAMQPRIRNTVRRVLQSGAITLVQFDWTLNVTLPDGQAHVEHGTASQVMEKDCDGGRRSRLSTRPG